MAWSAPPTSFQLVILPVKMPWSCSMLRLVTPQSLWATGPMPTTQTWLSLILARSSALESLVSAKTSESPICTAPWEICVMPWPEPPP